MGEVGGSAIFTGLRPLGYVSNSVPCVARYVVRRQEHLIVTVAGRTFLTWGSNKLGLLSVSKVHPEDITALAADSYLVFVAAGKNIYVWRRGNELQRVFRGHTSRVHLLLPFGPHLISVDDNSVMKVWDIKTGAEYLEMTFNNERTLVSALCHPSTYMDKVLVGSKQGHLQLWNLKSTKLVYTFEGWESRVVCLEQAPAIDVVAIGLMSGDIYVHNLKYDETIVKFHQDWGPVTCISFRSDGQPLMLSGSQCGHVAVWDLEARKLSSQMRSAHQASVAGARCLPGEPLLVTNSPDNSIKMWIFDMTDGGGRLLRQREGHAAPPSRIRFYGASGENILSAGLDSSLRVFSTVADLLNKNLGHASFNRKKSKKHRVVDDPVRMPNITEFTTETTRDREWDNIACVHRGVNIATTWSYGNCKMGELQLLHERFKKEPELKDAKATCLCLSSCGNFVVIGYSSGHVDRFNIQSGIHRGTYQHGNKPAHKNPLRGLATDALNQRVISADSKGVVKFWNFKSKGVGKTGSLLGKLLLEQDLSLIRLHRESNLLAVVLEDFSVSLIDIDTRRVVRTFVGHSSPISDCCFSYDSRWLVTVSLDTTARVWDLPSGQCVDYLQFPSPATSVDFSPAGDVLATSHVGDLGIHLWTNKALYQHITLAPLNKDALPCSLAIKTDLDSEPEITVPEDVPMEDLEDYKSAAQISLDLITLANLPGSRWLNLLNLDVIKSKNKPKAPPKKPKAAPFFLPTIPGLETKFDLSNISKEDENSSGKKAIGITNFTQFGASLGQAESEEDYIGMIDDLLAKGPSAIDLEIRSLGPEGGGTLGLLLQFLKMILTGLDTNLNFEVLEAWLGLFLKIHGDLVSSEEDLVAEVRNIQSKRDSKWKQINEEMDSSLCMVTFFKSSFL